MRYHCTLIIRTKIQKKNKKKQKNLMVPIANGDAEE